MHVGAMLARWWAVGGRQKKDYCVHRPVRYVRIAQTRKRHGRRDCSQDLYGRAMSAACVRSGWEENATRDTQGPPE